MLFIYPWSLLVIFRQNVEVPFKFQPVLQVLELGVQLSVLLGNPVANLEELLTWTEAELLRVTSGDTDMQHTRAQVCLNLCCIEHFCVNLIHVKFFNRIWSQNATMLCCRIYHIII